MNLQVKNVKNRFFTLIELIVVIVVLGILAAIVIPNVSNIKGKANEASLEANQASIQMGVDLYALNNDGEYPTFDKVDIGKPQFINLLELKPKYIRNLPKDDGVKYQVDYLGNVFNSTALPPSNVIMNKDSGKLQWEEALGAVSYNIYEITDLNSTGIVKNKTLKSVTNTKDSFYQGEVNRNYAVSSVDEKGYETAPVGDEYIGGVALGFGGKNNYIEFPSTSSEKLNEELTVEAVVKFNELSGSQTIISKTGAAFRDTVFWLEVRNGENLFFGGYDEEGTKSYINTKYPFEKDKWYYIVGVDDGDNLSVYVNGEKVHSIKSIPRRILPDANIKVGKRGDESNQNHFTGKMSDIRVWSKAISSEEIKERPIKLTGDEEDLVLYLKFDEAQGTKVKDSSKNKYEGIIYGATWSTKE